MLTFRRKTVIRILLLVARMLEDGPWTNEIQHLSNHVAAHPIEELKVAS